MIYQFAEFTLDTVQHTLQKQGKVIKLGDKPFKLVVLLVKHSPETVTKQQVMEEVWAGRVVTESTLYKTISRIRKDLQDEGLSIESVFSEGYRISASVKSIKTQEHQAVTDQYLLQQKTSKSVWHRSWIWIMAAVFLGSVLVLSMSQFVPKRTLGEAMQDMRQAMSTNKKAFLSQIKRRNELGDMLVKRLEVDTDLSWERRFFEHHQQMNEAELFVFEQIRAYTTGPMLTNNQLILDLLNDHPQILEQIPLADELRNHLILWLNKYHQVFKDNKKMCLLYVGVEDGAPYPSEVDQQVIDWLENSTK